MIEARCKKITDRETWYASFTDYVASTETSEALYARDCANKCCGQRFYTVVESTRQHCASCTDKPLALMSARMRGAYTAYTLEGQPAAEVAERLDATPHVIRSEARKAASEILKYYSDRERLAKAKG